MEITSRKDSTLARNKNFYKNKKIKKYRTNYKNKKMYKKTIDIREILIGQCIVCSIFLFIILSLNYIDNELTYNFRKDIKKLITEDIKKEKVILYFNLASNKFSSLVKNLNNKCEIKNNLDSTKKQQVFKTKNKLFKIDEDILEEINKKEKSNNFTKNNFSIYTKADSKIWINPSEGIITSLFGNRINPISKKEEFHNGIDIAMEENTNILAMRDGIVTDISFSKTFGNVLKYEVDENYEIMCAHLNYLNVNIGDKIKQGDIIALSGNTGLTTGPHLHITIWKNKELIDPINYINLPFTEEVKNELEKREAL